MEKLTIDEQDVTNAICLYVADEKHLEPRHVEVELAYDDQLGFSAEAFYERGRMSLSHHQMIQAIRFWIDETLQEDPSSAAIRLELDDAEGIVAHIR